MGLKVWIEGPLCRNSHFTQIYETMGERGRGQPIQPMKVKKYCTGPSTGKLTKSKGHGPHRALTRPVHQRVHLRNYKFCSRAGRRCT